VVGRGEQFQVVLLLLGWRKGIANACIPLPNMACEENTVMDQIPWESVCLKEFRERLVLAQEQLKLLWSRVNPNWA